MNESYPKAYKRGLQDFHGREFIVTPDVLIPRPETEMMIDAVLILAGKPYLPGVKPAPRVLPQNLSILDVGTGSGCIAITLALELPEAKITACDISEKALAVARKNAEKFGTEIELVQSDLLENIDGEFDVVIANLPYVDKDWEWLDREALSHEPAMALYAKNHGLELIYKLIDQAVERKNPTLDIRSGHLSTRTDCRFCQQKGPQAN